MNRPPQALRRRLKARLAQSNLSPARLCTDVGRGPPARVAPLFVQYLCLSRPPLRLSPSYVIHHAPKESHFEWKGRVLNGLTEEATSVYTVYRKPATHDASHAFISSPHALQCSAFLTGTKHLLQALHMFPSAHTHSSPNCLLESRSVPHSLHLEV